MNIRSIITISLIHFLWGYCLCSENVTKVVKPAINYRLPRDIFPEYYKLNILTHLNDEEGFKYYGDVRIKVIFGIICIFFHHFAEMFLKRKSNSLKVEICSSNGFEDIKSRASWMINKWFSTNGSFGFFIILFVSFQQFNM